MNFLDHPDYKRWADRWAALLVEHSNDKRQAMEKFREELRAAAAAPAVKAAKPKR
jgi:hypothetical protein